MREWFRGLFGSAEAPSAGPVAEQKSEPGQGAKAEQASPRTVAELLRLDDTARREAIRRLWMKEGRTVRVWSKSGRAFVEAKIGLITEDGSVRVDYGSGEHAKFKFVSFEDLARWERGEEG